MNTTNIIPLNIIMNTKNPAIKIKTYQIIIYHRVIIAIDNLRVFHSASKNEEINTIKPSYTHTYNKTIILYSHPPQYTNYNNNKIHNI